MQDIGLGLGNNANANAWIAVGTRVTAYVFGRQFDVGDFAQPHEVSIGALSKNKLLKIRHDAKAGISAKCELPCARLQPSRGDLHIFAPQRIFDIRDRKTTCGKPLRIHPNAHCRTSRTAVADHRNAIDDTERIDQIAIDEVGNLHQRTRVTGDADPHRGFGGVVLFGDDWRIGFIRQHAQDA